MNFGLELSATKTSNAAFWVKHISLKHYVVVVVFTETVAVVASRVTSMD